MRTSVRFVVSIAISSVLFLSEHALAHQVRIEHFVLKTPRGAMVRGKTSLPELNHPAPVLILAPGQKYHMDLPLMTLLADRASKSGIAVIRFNWNYFSSNPQTGEPSEYYLNEIEDMRTVLTYARLNPRIDASRILIGGKSLGSAVAYRVFRQDGKLKQLALFTPVCSNKTDENGNPYPEPKPVGDEYYPGFSQVRAPVLMTLGNADDLCDVHVLADFLTKNSRRNVYPVIVEGNHSFLIPNASEERNAANLRLAVERSLFWIKAVLGVTGR